MVEEANRYYQHGLHECYQHFQNTNTFKNLRASHLTEGIPTVQEIITALGVQSMGKPYEGGIAAINIHLEKEGKPVLVRHVEWDLEETQAAQQPSPAPDPENDMDEENEESIQMAAHETSAASSSCTFSEFGRPLNSPSLYPQQLPLEFGCVYLPDIETHALGSIDWMKMHGSLLARMTASGHFAAG